MDFELFEKATLHRENEGVYARFYDRIIKTQKTDENGFPIFKTVPYVEIMMKDNTSEIYNQPADDEKMRRFPMEYAHYLNQKQHVPDGIPLNQYAFLSAVEVASLNERGIMTIQELASLDDEKARTLGVLHEKELARNFVDFAADSSILQKKTEEEKRLKEKIVSLSEKLESSDNKINDLKKEINRLKNKIKQLKGEYHG